MGRFGIEGRMRLALAMLLVGACAAPTQAGLFAKHAVGVTGIYGSPRPMTVTAPDGRTRAIARFSDWTPDDDSDDHLSVFIGGDDHDFAGGPHAELLWAPDSRALAVTANAVTADDEDGQGSFETTILVRKPKGRHWREINLTRKIRKLFAPQMLCDDHEKANVGAVGWTSGQRLIVAAQVPVHSSCANRGGTAAYIVDVQTGDVLMDVDARVLRQRYGQMLGTAFPKIRAHHHRHRRKR
ncbi:hypothetical protein [Sphingomonas abietis]|uniref:Uncharacterized protein n=1 Tax=Sphingomonas abietis TaxID=3012344 RepID=A0ABY7NRA7_9SPHN|nr:hypothetical protein [Sphingomonas abietis]WBO22484.1 hypothetical protein PBT88_20515 [Sphingomonas abietis]